MTTSGDPKSPREINARFGRLYGREVKHVRVNADRDQWVQVIGTLAELHGPQGVCTCCPRRRR